MAYYGLHGKLNATPGNGDALADILREASSVVRSCRGSKIYVVSRDTAEPDTVWVTEVWDTKEDHDDSLSSADVRALIGKALPMLAGMPEKGQELQVVAGIE